MVAIRNLATLAGSAALLTLVACSSGSGSPADNTNERSSNVGCDAASGFVDENKLSYQVTFTAQHDGERVSFEVHSPAPEHIDCAKGSPVILQGHGFGGSRNTNRDAYTDFLEAGFTVVSIDQRGFGDSSGTVRVMDPNAEGKSLIEMMDWLEENLSYLSYRDDEACREARYGDGDAAICDPVIQADSNNLDNPNLLVGAIGGSYGGGYQFLLQNTDPKQRLDSLSPVVTWHDLRYSLNPGDTIKSGWDLLLSAGGEAGSYQPGLENQDNIITSRGMDFFIKETLAQGALTNEFPRAALEWFNYHSPSYWCGLAGRPQMPYNALEPVADINPVLAGLIQGEDGPRMQLPEGGLKPVDVLINQGFRDTLFDFNDAWWNFLCYSELAGDKADVRLTTMQTGHLLSGFDQGTGIFQQPGGSGVCPAAELSDLTWFKALLLNQTDALAALDTSFDGGDSICVSLDNAGDQSVLIPESDFAGPDGKGGLQGQYLDFTGLTASNMPHGAAAVAAWGLDVADMLVFNQIPGRDSLPVSAPAVTVMELGTVTSDTAVLAGVPMVDVTLEGPTGMRATACDVGTVPTLRVGCDAIVLLALAKQVDGGWQIIDDQLTPVRGIGQHNQVEMVGVADALVAGDKLALLAMGHHGQFVTSFSRDVTLPVVNVTADLKLPLYSGSLE